MSIGWQLDSPEPTNHFKVNFHNLRIKPIQANILLIKGEVERLIGLLQDRLVIVFCEVNAHTLKEVNQVH